MYVFYLLELIYIYMLMELFEVERSSRHQEVLNDLVALTADDGAGCLSPQRLLHLLQSSIAP
jgi:hypothetical protein